MTKRAVGQQLRIGGTPGWAGRRPPSTHQRTSASSPSEATHTPGQPTSNLAILGSRSCFWSSEPWGGRRGIRGHSGPWVAVRGDLARREGVCASITFNSTPSVF